MNWLQKIALKVSIGHGILLIGNRLHVFDGFHTMYLEEHFNIAHRLSGYIENLLPKGRASSERDGSTLIAISSDLNTPEYRRELVTMLGLSWMDRPEFDVDGYYNIGDTQNIANYIISDFKKGLVEKDKIQSSMDFIQKYLPKLYELIAPVILGHKV